MIQKHHWLMKIREAGTNINNKCEMKVPWVYNMDVTDINNNSKKITFPGLWERERKGVLLKPLIHIIHNQAKWKSQSKTSTVTIQETVLFAAFRECMVSVRQNYRTFSLAWTYLRYNQERNTCIKEVYRYAIKLEFHYWDMSIWNWL
jgi:hypothetical protein